MSGKNCNIATLRRLFAMLCLPVLASITAPPATAASLPTHHVRAAVISGQAKFLNSVPAAQTLRVGILLPIRDQAGLNQFLQDVNDPSSPSYGHFLTVPEFTERFGPTQEDYNAVVYFAESKGMTVATVFPNRLLIDVIASVATIESAFHVKMGVYQHPTENRVFFAPDREPTVDLNVPLWHIAGLDDYSIPQPALARAQGATQATGSGPNGQFLPGDMRAAYYGGTALTGSGQCVGLAEFGGYLINDVALTFHGAASGSTNGTNFTLTYTTGGVQYTIPINNVALGGFVAGTDTGDAGEQALDIAQAIGMAPGLSQVRVYTVPNAWTQSGQYVFPSNSGDSLIFNQMASDNACKQLSLSWHWDPEDKTANDQVFQQLESQGQNLFVASGDWGSFPTPTPYYYPAEDDYVTGVGGTTLTTNGAGGSWAGEDTWGGPYNLCTVPPYYGSSGGISPDGIPIPSWQNQSGVVNSSNKGSTVYRNIPDVAAEGNCDNYYCSQGTCTSSGGEGGTSYAAPRWAGYLALANQEQVADGKSSFTFINPLIYTIGLGSGYTAAFHDITIGDNYTATNPSLYPAVTGYDLVTGWGSPNGSGLINALTGTTGSYTISLTLEVTGSSSYPSASLCVNGTCANDSGGGGSAKATFGSGSNISWTTSGPAGSCALPGTGGQHGTWVYGGVGGYINSSAHSGEFTMPAENISLVTGWTCEAN
ncbi:MAG: protease pro-enzyme activation domain-containing protein [Terriglobia bacterium]